MREAGAIGANQGGVTDLRWYKGEDALLTPGKGEGGKDGEYRPKRSGTFFVSGGFDKNVQVFSGDDWAKVKTLSGHSGNVLGVDVSRDAKWIASCGHDRTVKVWARDDGEAV